MNQKEIENKTTGTEKRESSEVGDKLDTSKKRVGGKLLTMFEEFKAEKGATLSGIKSQRDLIAAFKDRANETRGGETVAFLNELFSQIEKRNIDSNEFFDVFFKELGGFHVNLADIMRDDAERFYEDLTTKNNRQAMFLLVRDKTFELLRPKEQERFEELYGNRFPFKAKKIDEIKHWKAGHNYLDDFYKTLLVFLNSDTFDRLYPSSSEEDIAERVVDIIESIEGVNIQNKHIKKHFARQGILQAGIERDIQIKKEGDLYSKFTAYLKSLLSGEKNSDLVADRNGLVKALGRQNAEEILENAEYMQEATRGFVHALDFQGIGQAIIAAPHFSRFSRVLYRKIPDLVRDGVIQPKKLKEAIKLYATWLTDNRASIAGMDSQVILILEGFARHIDDFGKNVKNERMDAWKATFLRYSFKKGYIYRHRESLKALLRKHPMMSKIDIQQYTDFWTHVYDLDCMEVPIPWLDNEQLVFTKKSLTFPTVTPDTRFADIFSNFQLDFEVDLENSSANIRSLVGFTADEEDINKIVYTKDPLTEETMSTSWISKDTEYLIKNKQGQLYVQHKQTKEYLRIDAEGYNQDSSLQKGTHQTYQLVSGYPTEHNSKTAIVLLEKSDQDRRQELSGRTTDLPEENSTLISETPVAGAVFLKKDIGTTWEFVPKSQPALVLSQTVIPGAVNQSTNPFAKLQRYMLIDATLPETNKEKGMYTSPSVYEAIVGQKESAEDIKNELESVPGVTTESSQDEERLQKKERYFGRFETFDEFLQQRSSAERQSSMLKNLTNQYKQLGPRGMPAWVYEGKVYYNKRYFEAKYGLRIESLANGGHAFRYDINSFGPELRERLKIRMAEEAAVAGEDLDHATISNRQVYEYIQTKYPRVATMPSLTLRRLLQPGPINVGGVTIPSLDMLRGPFEDKKSTKSREFLDELRTMKNHESMHILLQYSGFLYEFDNADPEQRKRRDDQYKRNQEAQIPESIYESIQGDSLLVVCEDGRHVALTHELLCRIAEGPKKPARNVEEVQEELTLMDEAYEQYGIIYQDDFPDRGARQQWLTERKANHFVELVDRQNNIPYKVPLAAIEEALQHYQVFDGDPGSEQVVEQDIARAGGMTPAQADRLLSGEGFADLSKKVTKLGLDQTDGLSAKVDVFERFAAARSAYITEPVSIQDIQQAQDRIFVVDASNQSAGRRLIPPGAERLPNVYTIDFSNLPAEPEQARQAVIDRMEGLEKAGRLGQQNRTWVYPRDGDGGRILIGDELQNQFPQLYGLVQNSVGGIANRQNQGGDVPATTTNTPAGGQEGNRNNQERTQGSSNENTNQSSRDQNGVDSRNENQSVNIVELFDSMAMGNKSATLAQGRVRVVLRTQASGLDGGGSDWGVARVSALPNNEGIAVSGGAEGDNWGPISFEGGKEINNFFRRAQNKVYVFEDKIPTLSGSFIDPFQSESYVKGAFKNYPDGRGSDKVKVEGTSVTKKVTAGDGSTSNEPVTHIGILPSLGGANDASAIRYAVDRGPNSVDVELIGNDSISFKKRMPYDEFAVFVADKNLQPYTEDEHKLVETSIETAKGKTGSGFRLMSFKSMREGLKELKETWIDDLFGNRQELDKLHFMNAMTSWLPDGAPLNLGMLKARVQAKIDGEAWQKIQKFKGELSGIDDGSDSHAAKVTDLIATQIFKVGSKGLFRDKREFQYRAAGYLLYALDAGGPYIRKLAPYLADARRVGALFGEAKRKEFLAKRNKEFGIVKNADSLSDRQLDLFVKMELNFIQITAGDDQFEPIYGTKFHRAVEDGKDGFSGTDAMNDVADAIANKGNVTDAYDAFASGIKNNIPKGTLGGVGGLEKLVEDDYDYKVFYQAIMLTLVSGFGLYGLSKSGKDAFAGICRKRGVPIGLLVGDVNNPKTTLDIVDYIMRQSGGSSLTKTIRSGMEKAGFANWTPESVTPETWQKDGYQKALRKIFDTWWNQNGETVMDAFNINESTALIGYEYASDDEISNDQKVAVSKYFSSGLYNPYMDYKERVDFDGDSPFYKNGILNVAPGTFESVLFSFNARGEVSDDRGSDMWDQLRDKFTSVNQAIQVEGANSNTGRSIYKFVVKRMLWYFRKKINDENLAKFKAALLSGNIEGKDGCHDILKKYILGEAASRTQVTDNAVKDAISEFVVLLKQGNNISNLSTLINDI